MPACAAAPALLRWSTLLDPPMDGARNMARDHALALGLRAGEAVLRIYRWASPTVSFGRNEPTEAFGSLRTDSRRLAFVRRPTGGRAVLHHRELTYSVALPAPAFGGPRGAYAALNRGLVRGLEALGVCGSLATGGLVEALGAGPCFRRPAQGEVTVGGRKLVGSAQVRLGSTLLQHGSLLIGPGQELLEHAASTPAAPAAGPTSLEQLLGSEPDWSQLVSAVTCGLAAELGGDWSEPAAPAVDAALEAELLARYASDGWTWRR